MCCGAPGQPRSRLHLAKELARPIAADGVAVLVERRADVPLEGQRAPVEDRDAVVAPLGHQQAVARHLNALRAVQLSVTVAQTTDGAEERAG